MSQDTETIIRQAARKLAAEYRLNADIFEEDLWHELKGKMPDGESLPDRINIMCDLEMHMESQIKIETKTGGRIYHEREPTIFTKGGRLCLSNIQFFLQAKD